MMSASEMDTVVKKILPYLRRREYEDIDLDFETAMKLKSRYALGYADILVTCGKAKPQFLIEAKKDSRTLTAKDRDQALEYGDTLKTPFVVVTNGKAIQCFNTLTKKPIRWNGKLTDKIPSKTQLAKVLAAFKANPSIDDIQIGDKQAPFRPTLPLKQLNALFKRCHNTIRKIEKNEENAFSDFSKLLFLKLLEEKSDLGQFDIPYSYRFDQLAEKPPNEADQVKTAIESMIQKIKDDLGYGDILGDPLRLKTAKTFQYIVRQLSDVYFGDSNLDSKGAAFEYFVRATLKGKKLGQYFTPRPLIEVMVNLCGRDKIVNALRSGDQPLVLDPSCGTGGFLVYLLNLCISIVDGAAHQNQITQSTKNKLLKALKKHTFYGSDANEGVACSAKMNMVVAGDGHNNITAEDSLALSASNWKPDDPKYDLILTNPPFGTSESESLTVTDLKAFPVASTKGQVLFLQKMVQAVKAGGEICTVIDEGVLNVDSAAPLRDWLLQNCVLVAVVRLPEDTFKPNKINVRSSVLYLRKHEKVDHDLENSYSVTFCDLESLGYLGSGDAIRNFEMTKLLSEVGSKVINQQLGSPRSGYQWRAFDIPFSEIATDATKRLDLKYWEPEIRNKINALKASGAPSLRSLNLIKTARGKSPSAELYVDEPDGYAAVVKAGSSINRYGEVCLDGDYVEKDVYDGSPKRCRIERGDILLASTGDGTLGKCGKYDEDKSAIADGHVTIIRPNKQQIDPGYLTDYLRAGFGALQIQRLYSGSTGLIELTPEHVDTIIVDSLKGDLSAQRDASIHLRKAEQLYRDQIDLASVSFSNAVVKFNKP
jgi:type I restriction enzyme M protein